MIYGRDAERSHLADLAEAARAGVSGALVVRGEAGAGKTSLLDELVANASGMRSLRAVGVEAQFELPFSGLNELLAPLLDRLGALAPARRRALSTALGIAGSRFAPARFPIAAAVLDLLAAAAEQEPLLAIVDDAHWLDGSSQDALLFVARRLAGEGIALIFGASGEFEALGVPWLELSPPLARDADARYRELVSALPEGTRARLLPAALDPAAELDVSASEAPGVVRLDGERAVFDHPLARSAVLAETTVAERRQAHLALAAALPESERERRAWHAALAASEPDDALAGALEDVARHARARAGHAAAQAALTRAAELTAEARMRGSRLVAAAHDAWQAGRADDALALLDRAEAVLDEPSENAAAARLRGVITLHSGSLADAHRLLMDAARETAEIDPKTAYKLVGEAAKAGGISQDRGWLMAAGELASSFAEPRDATSRMIRRAVIGFGASAAGVAPDGLDELREVVAAAQRIDDPELLEYAVAAAGLLGDEQLTARLLAKAEDAARQRTMVGSLPLLLVLRAAADYDAGRLAGAAAAADEGARLAREAGQTTILAASLAHVARAAAVRGDAARYATAGSEARALAARHGLALVGSIAAHADALHEIGLGRYEAAMDALERVVHRACAASQASDACDVAIHLDRISDAMIARARLEELAEETRLPWVEGLVERARGVTTNRGDRHFARAIALHGAARPFDRGRTELAHGETLRRTRRRMDARAPLRRALEIFERVGAEPWAARADRELRATGETARHRPPATPDRLTPQELAICELVAEGLTDAEIGISLLLSPRTIEYHLRKIFPKLGIRSRAELVLLDLGASEQGEHTTR